MYQIKLILTFVATILTAAFCLYIIETGPKDTKRDFHTREPFYHRSAIVALIIALTVLLCKLTD